MQPTIIQHQSSNFSAFQEAFKKIETIRQQEERERLRKNIEWAEQELERVVLNYSNTFGFPDNNNPL